MAEVKTVPRITDVLRCPKLSLSNTHYNEDGTCKCKENKCPT